MNPTETPSLSRGERILIAFLIVKLVWDGILLAWTWPEVSLPKLGIAVVLPFLIAGLLRGRQWAMNLTGVTCTFWIVFVFARLIGPMFTVGEVKLPFPWSNLLAFPAIVFVLNNLKSDEEIRVEKQAAEQQQPKPED